MSGYGIVTRIQPVPQHFHPNWLQNNYTSPPVAAAHFMELQILKDFVPLYIGSLTPDVILDVGARAANFHVVDTRLLRPVQDVIRVSFRLILPLQSVWYRSSGASAFLVSLDAWKAITGTPMSQPKKLLKLGTTLIYAFTSAVPSVLERSVAYNMANPLPFQPPAHLKKMFEDADTTLGDFLDDHRMQYFEHTLNKCGKASRCLNNLKPYFSQFCLIDEMYSMFPRFNTKMEKFKAAHAERLQAKFPAAVRRTMSSFEDLKKERTLLLPTRLPRTTMLALNPESSLSLPRRMSPRTSQTPITKTTALSPESISSDSEDEADAVEAQVDEDTHMEDDHIDLSEYPVILPWKPEPTQEESRLNGACSNRSGPRTSNNYTKAMAIVARTNPEEAQKVASSIVILPSAASEHFLLHPEPALISLR
ncbi:hypothetical protein B0H12DRAFT_1241268 [Mycena haematopus]|nr:hypothetical protein B0H12DRAFT_1241268 [Mycena haematopus]